MQTLLTPDGGGGLGDGPARQAVVLYNSRRED